MGAERGKHYHDWRVLGLAHLGGEVVFCVQQGAGYLVLKRTPPCKGALRELRRKLPAPAPTLWPEMDA